MKTGALISPKDPRDIPVTAVGTVKRVPRKYFTDISGLETYDQRNLGACVGHAHAFAVQYYNKVNASPRYLYALSKQIDGYAGQGTYPRTCAKVMVDDGCTTQDVTPNLTTLSHTEYINVKKDKSASKNKMQGYAYVDHTDKQAIKRAIVEFGIVTATLIVGDWSRVNVSPTKPRSAKELANGRHRIAIYGYDEDTFYFVNSWGKKWGKNGIGKFNYNTYAKVPESMHEFMVFTDLPNEVVKEYKAIQVYKYFTNKETKGLSPKLCDMLDVAREYAGIPFKINSGLRTKEQNEKAGGVKDSAHLTGKAVDIRAVDGEATFKIVESAIKAGFKRIGINRKAKFVHLDIDETKPSPTIYEYN